MYSHTIYILLLVTDEREEKRANRLFVCIKYNQLRRQTYERKESPFLLEIHSASATDYLCVCTLLYLNHWNWHTYIHYITLQYITLHSITWHYNTFHSIIYHSNPLHHIAFHFIPLHSIPFHYIPFHSITSY